MEEFENTLVQYEADRIKRATKAETDLSELIKFLKPHGVNLIKAIYEGCGDSGQIESVQFFNKDNTECTEHYIDTVIPCILPGATSVRDAVETCLFALLEKSQPGWEINEGSFGTFTINLETRDVVLQHNERIESVEEKSDHWAL